MGRDKPSFIIEFNGLPGCGKTTVSRLLADRLRSQGYRVTDIGYFLEGYKMSGLRRRFRIIRWGSIGCSLRMYGFLRSMGPVNKDRLKHAKHFSLHYSAYNKFTEGKTEGAAMVIDQGMVQYIIAAAHLQPIRDLAQLKKLLECVGEKAGSCIFVNCIADENTAGRRIISRGLNQGRFDVMQEEELLRNMRLQTANFESVRKCLSETKGIKSIDIDMKNSAENNCELLYEGISKMIMEVTADERR
jgi:predicted kinase